jgi:hypothetical protein
VGVGAGGTGDAGPGDAGDARGHAADAADARAGNAANARAGNAVGHTGDAANARAGDAAGHTADANGHTGDAAGVGVNEEADEALAEDAGLAIGVTETALAGAREDRAADRFYRAEVAPRAASLRRGGRLSVANVDGDDRYIAESFAGIYVVVVWFEGPFELDLARARVRRAQPRIEALTLALPPPDGPGTGTRGAKLPA